MDCRDPLASLVAFHANGTLGAEDRERVEAHLGGCAECREEYELARAAREEMGSGSHELRDHVQAQLLAEYADRPQSLETETLEWVESHLAACEVCESVLPALRGTSSVRTDEEESAAGGGRLWRFLAGTILRPAPALAYLLLAMAGVYWFATSDRGSLDEPAGLLSPAVHLYGEIAMRGGDDEAPPVRLEPVDDAPFRLALHTDLDPEDLSSEAGPLRLLLRRGGDVLWSARVEPGSIPPDGVLEMTLQPGRLPRDVPLEVALLPVPGAEPPLFSQRIILPRR